MLSLLLGLLSTLSTATVSSGSAIGPRAPEWTFNVVGNSGIVALESIIVSPTLALFFDRASDDPLQINNHSAWGALFNLETNEVTALNVLTNSFCASGALLSNGSMVSLGGDPRGFPGNPAIQPGNMGIRIFEPCENPAGVGCTLFEDPATLHLAEDRWYPSSIRIPDGSLMVIGGIHVNTDFYNSEGLAASTIEFFPPKDGGVPRPSAFLNRTLPANLFPRAFLLPDGKVFMVANNQSIIYDIETGEERPLPDLPNGVRVTNPLDGSAILLPLSPPDFTPEVLVCGGSNVSDAIPPGQLSSQFPASDQCTRIVLTEEGIQKGWAVEHMLENRVMPELVHLPNGQILIINGAGTGFAAIGTTFDAVSGNSNADHPVFTPSLYTPDAPLGQRISNKGMPTSNIARMYHSTVTLTPQGNFLVAGSNPNDNTNLTVKFPSEFRVETLDPPFIFVERPSINSVPEKIGFGETFTVPVTIPSNLKTSNIQVALMDLGFSSHAFHSSARLVFMDAKLSANKKSLTITTPPNRNVFPPAPAFIFLTVDNVSSTGQRVMCRKELSSAKTEVALIITRPVRPDRAAFTLILSDLAVNIGDTKDDPSHPELQTSIELVTSQVETRVEPEEEVEQPERVFMPNSRVHCNIGFAEVAINLPNTHIDETVPVLIDILHDIPYIDFDHCLAWDDWALPDQLAFATVSALLHVASSHPEHRKAATDAIKEFVAKIVVMLKKEDPCDILAQFAPSFHGFYRAITSIPFQWSLEEWTALATHLNTLFSNEVVEGLNHLLVDVLRREDDEPEKVLFIRTFLSRYISRGRPLSGYFIVCCVIEAHWTILAQALIPKPTEASSRIPESVEAAAANKAWQKLLNEAIDSSISGDEEYRQTLTATIDHSMKCFSNLLVQIEEMDTEPSEDSYAWETMSESLKLASICSAASHTLDKQLHARVQLLLSEESPISDNLVQEAALKSTAILVRNFPEIAAKMASHLRKFVTAPLPIFEFEFTPGTRTPPPLIAAAKCLALCIDLAPGDDLVMSYMYSLLNHIAATSKETFEVASALRNSLDGADAATLYSLETGLRGLSEDEKRLVGISTISVVTRLALEFQSEEACSHLHRKKETARLRTAEPTVEAAIAYNLVDLALEAPEASFTDIIRVFSSINRSANTDDPRFTNNMVLAAQTRLARELDRRPELYELYLIELLTLFSDKGVAIQNLAISDHRAKVLFRIFSSCPAIEWRIQMEDVTEQLASLLLPIDALLSHPDFKLSDNPSSSLVTLFRNMWLLCILFHFTTADDKDHVAMGWQKPALIRIAMKTPTIVLEEAHDTIVSDLEYNPVLRREYVETVVSRHREMLTRHTPLRNGEIRSLFPGQVIFLLCMHDMERMRSATGLPASLVSYFTNNGLNKNLAFVQCMEAIAEKVIRECAADLNVLAGKQSLPPVLSQQLQSLLVCSTHRIARARDIACKYLNRLINSFPSLMCDPPLIFAILETLTLLRRACENEFLDEDNPSYVFKSERMELTLKLTDDYSARNQMLTQLRRDAYNWFELALGRAPIELHATLQKYLSMNPSTSLADPSDLGPSIAMELVKAYGPIDRKLASLTTMLPPKRDRAKVTIGQLASKAFFSGEASGFHIARTLDSKRDDVPTSPQELKLLKDRMVEAIQAIILKQSTLTMRDLRRLLFRCAATIINLEKCEHDLIHYLVVLPFEAFNPGAISAGIEAWSWVISEKPEYEISLMSKITSSWIETIKLERGIFSKALNYCDPFYHPVEYSPSEREAVERSSKSAQRLLTPHTIVLQLLRLMLASMDARAHMSTHPLAREARFSLLLFAFEVLRSSYLDIYCENQIREDIYLTAFAWFSVRPQWSFGASRVQIDTDIKVLAEFLQCLQGDTVRGFPAISSLASAQAFPSISYYQTYLKTHNSPLRLLVDNEMYRLTVWTNPSNDIKRGTDHVNAVEKVMTDSTWVTALRTLWQLDPAIAVHLPERFHVPLLSGEVMRLIRSSTRDVVDIPEALRFLVGERLDVAVQRDLKYLLLWAPVPPVLAITFFEKRYRNDPLLLQYAHRVLEQHPVELTFFFVPQVVQALRYDELGYVARFIFETAKISQLFCHQIIWNMKANCFKDDAAEIPDSLKPTLDQITELVVASLSGDAREFYDREFTFFDGVTSISGKLKPFIKKTKVEKKAKIDEEMAKIRVEVGVYLPSNPDGIVVDIDKKSGRPLQSHAKAPFMATFKVRKTRTIVAEDLEMLGDGAEIEKSEEYDVWQAAIFKVGDDCRQDVLALQVIAMFKNIFNSVGLTVYLFPYRVTATAPGCGVIDVVPNATSRDEMGRAKVNDLLDFFVAKYGGEDTVEFQRARLNFIQSMAAYSVACYILQIKDRHNGNIMIDGEGHIVHIDFGFLFDIDEYISFSFKAHGVKFEPSSFKLTHEMVVLMGGRYSQGYLLFQQLTVKAFLAIRPYMDQLVNTVQLMLDTGLPSFKGEPTIRRLRDRFAPGLNERQAAEFMMAIVRNAHENVRSTAYDEFQRVRFSVVSFTARTN
ncbi:hypothetical protein NM688_g2347 [Phlebia brevispora]|uniref:Uncharacterized protein n=1 Tax=Phlebia brevispora TaxID=194682 RepID=A0ACC1T920_9APHY|nr:hypothetical protein NM688_g2347 [Phlebia brevispora]